MSMGTRADGGEQTFRTAAGLSNSGGNFDPNELSQKLGALEMSAPPKTPGKSRGGRSMDREFTNVSFMGEQSGRRNSLQLPAVAAARMRSSGVIKKGR